MQQRETVICLPCTSNTCTVRVVSTPRSVVVPATTVEPRVGSAPDPTSMVSALLIGAIEDIIPGSLQKAHQSRGAFRRVLPSYLRQEKGDDPH